MSQHAKVREEGCGVGEGAVVDADDAGNNNGNN